MTILEAFLDFLSGLFGLRRSPRQQHLPLGLKVAHDEPGGGPAAHALAADLEAVASACEKAEAFSRADIVKRTGLGIDVVKRRLNVLLDMGWIERAKHGDYRWKGRVYWEKEGSGI